jgi:hypothetical protein
MTDGGYQSPRKKNSMPGALEHSKRAFDVGKAVRPEKDASSLGSQAPVKGRMLTQHTGLLPRPGMKGRGRSLSISFDAKVPEAARPTCSARAFCEAKGGSDVGEKQPRFAFAVGGVQHLPLTGGKRGVRMGDLAGALVDLPRAVVASDLSRGSSLQIEKMPVGIVADPMLRQVCANSVEIVRGGKRRRLHMRYQAPRERRRQGSDLATLPAVASWLVAGLWGAG